MSRVIRFLIAGDFEYQEDRPYTFVQMSDVDCRDLMAWLWLDPIDFGYVQAGDLAARCRRRLWPLARNNDPAVPSRESRNGNVRLVVAGRAAGYLRARTQDLLKLAQRAGPDGQILFS